MPKIALVEYQVFEVETNKGACQHDQSANFLKIYVVEMGRMVSENVAQFEMFNMTSPMTSNEDNKFTFQFDEVND